MKPTEYQRCTAWISFCQIAIKKFVKWQQDITYCCDFVKLLIFDIMSSHLFLIPSVSCFPHRYKFFFNLGIFVSLLSNVGGKTLWRPICVQIWFSWLLDHAIYLQLRERIINVKLSKFTKWHSWMNKVVILNENSILVNFT